MSYDFRLGTDRSRFYESNYTFNIYKIWAAATDGQSMQNLDGLYGWQVATVIGKVLVKLGTERAKFVALEPENKWGTVDSFSSFLANLQRACLLHPRARLHVFA
jgi:hypothetical protein